MVRRVGFWIMTFDVGLSKWIRKCSSHTSHIAHLSQLYSLENDPTQNNFNRNWLRLSLITSFSRQPSAITSPKCRSWCCRQPLKGNCDWVLKYKNCDFYVVTLHDFYGRIKHNKKTESSTAQKQASHEGWYFLSFFYYSGIRRCSPRRCWGFNRKNR